MTNQPAPVLPPPDACCANDLWDIVLPAEVEKAGNETHAFDWMEARCCNCDCRPGGQWARFACQGRSADLMGAVSFADFIAGTVTA